MTTTAATPPAHVSRPIGPAVLRQLRTRDDAGVTRTPLADPDGGAPLRCCLRHSTAGERILLVSYAPLQRWAAETGAEPGPYDERGPVFIHAEECGGPAPAPDGCTDPAYPVRMHGARRVLRAYDAQGRILGGRLIEIPVERAAEVDTALAEVFADPQVALVHVRAVEFGCFLLEVRRR
ncbi:DUF1203 domain-containing protein [Streptomyces cinnamoneus]|uniref:DUF1203 domain-containing protein n=1 Tax=Streptomyces cinnamoneus TaxID=53446 RepID=A0A918WE07_STRCJ|nr:DUF1203 domain-containing protein [Streptomyces cinnamoneus]GHC37308.1 hypothetical protein GCM10010507_08370 [Streptomyces cinnamoneus]